VLLAAALRTGVPVKLSRDAGRYLCNYAYGQALAATHDAQPAVFVHVPKLPSAQRRRGSRRGRGVTMNALVRTAETLILLMPPIVRNRR
jgi:pyroglutamyl-peptidase